MRNFIKSRLFATILTSIILASSITFIILLAGTSLLSAKWLVPMSVVILLVISAVFFLVGDFKKRIRAIIGIILALLLLISEIVGGFYLLHGASALEHITKPEVEFAEIGVYVLNDSPAKEISQTKGFKFGILDELDRENTNSALEELGSVLGEDVSIKEFEGLEQLFSALLEGEIDAVLANTSLFELLEDTDDLSLNLSLVIRLHIFEVESKGDKLPENPVLKDDNTFILYITGIDTRSKKISKRSRSDVNILAAVNTETRQIALISTPRDYYVPLSISRGIPDKLTHSGVYGTNVSIDTMEMIYGIDIDYYFKVNFTGFKDIIDALGGVTVKAELSFSSGPYYFRKGYNFVDGEAALAFARNRKNTGGDRQRGIHQMAVIRGVIEKAVSPALLTNYTKVLDGIKGSFETSVPYDFIAKLVRNQLDDGTEWNIVSYAVNGTGATRSVYSLSQKAYVLIPDKSTIDKAKSLMEQVRLGNVPVLN